MENLVKFIKKNKLKFTEGRRNSDSVILSGYALYESEDNVQTLIGAVNKACPKADDDFDSELRRVFDYAQKNNYGDYWTTDEAKRMYVY